MNYQKTTDDCLTESENARNMSDADHKEIQIATVAQSMRNERRLERIEKLLIILSAATLFNAVTLLLVQL